MTKLPTVREPQPSADPAALAFEALREEVALLRRAISGLAAERAAIEIPDYSETLGQLQQASQQSAKSLKALKELPILNASARDWARAIEEQGEPVRRNDRQALSCILGHLRQVAGEMSAKLSSARAADVQRQWLLWTFGGGVIAGVLFWIFAIVPLVHALI